MEFFVKSCIVKKRIERKDVCLNKVLNILQQMPQIVRQTSCWQLEENPKFDTDLTIRLDTTLRNKYRTLRDQTKIEMSEVMLQQLRNM